ncbi:MAG TPA: hypothetical protein EYP62_04590 [Kiritimatiellae bacterium]|nr:hypothetical protein [Kiritimatiellia bacterium]
MKNCGGVCDDCPATNSTRRRHSRHAFGGGRLVAWSAVVFLLPVSAAIAGAALVRGDLAVQWAAGSLGFALGCTVAWLLNRTVNQSSP